MRPRFNLPIIQCLLVLPIATKAYSIDCTNVVVDKKQFDLGPLDGPLSLYKISKTQQMITNTTFSLNICRPLQKRKGVPKDEDCPNGSRVCAIERTTNTIEDETIISATIPIAGELKNAGGGHLDAKWSRLKTSPSNADTKKEGLRLEMGGGKYKKEDQKAIVEFICPKAEDLMSRRKDGVSIAKRDDGEEEDDGDDDKSGELIDDEHDGTLKYISWQPEGGSKVLRLEWMTKYACEDSKDDGEKSSSNHWGFFTWFIIIVFLGIAAYLIFGSWLNYNRRGTRGFDSVPHADSIRDFPYLLKDWMRRVVDTVQGGHSRAGYSAV